MPLSAPLELYRTAALRLGMGFEVLDPLCGYLGQVEWQGRRRLLHASLLPLNDAVAFRLAQDKFYCGVLLRRAGFRVPETVRCLRPATASEDCPGLADGPEPGRELASRLGYPLIVKPNDLGGGRLVAKVEDESALHQALEEVWTESRLALVQEVIPGSDLRLDFLRGRFLIGYRRLPLRLKGDGRCSLRRLAESQDRRFGEDEFWRCLRRRPGWRRLSERGWDETTVLAKDQAVDFDDCVLNLNGFAVGRMVLEADDEWVDWGVRVGRVLGLRAFGVDFKVADEDTRPQEATVLEVNGAPSLTRLYRIGPAEPVLCAAEELLKSLFEGADWSR